MATCFRMVSCFIDSSDVNNIYGGLENGEKIPVINLKITMLNHGDKFCLKAWQQIL